MGREIERKPWNVAFQRPRKENKVNLGPSIYMSVFVSLGKLHIFLVKLKMESRKEHGV